MVMLPEKEGISFAKELAKIPSVVFLDIETIPSQEPWVKDYISNSIKHPGQMKKQETIDKWIAEEKQNAVEEALEKCGLEGSTNHIICISVAINNAKPVSFTASKHKDEEKLLKDFDKYLCDSLSDRMPNKFVGHNIINFDLKVINQRCMILGCKPKFQLPHDVKPWDRDFVYDTMQAWDAKNYIKLDRLAMAFGIKGKSMDGSQVYPMWKNGLIEQIKDYCEGDVEMVRNVFMRMRFSEF